MTIYYFIKLLLISSLALLATISIAQPTNIVLLTADKSTSLLTYSLRMGTQSRGGVNRNVTASASYNSATQQLEQLRVQSKLSAFSVGVPTDDAHTLRRLNEVAYPDLDFVSERIDYDTDNQLILSGTLLFHGVQNPVRLQASQTLGNRQLLIESMFLVDPAAHQLRAVNWKAFRPKGTLQIAFMIVLPLPAPAAPDLLGHQESRP